jgi:hypothetical protein
MRAFTFVIVICVAAAATALSPPLDPYGMVNQPLESFGVPGPYSNISTRVVSNAVSSEKQVVDDPREFNMLGVIFGQFVDHDIILSMAGGEGAGDSWPIHVPADDPTYGAVGFTEMEFTRVGRGSVNAITPHVDASAVYGSTRERLDLIRQTGTPYLRTDQHRMPPVSGETDLFIDGSPSQNMFFCGDGRCSENVFLTAIHTVWIREHNHQARRISLEFGEELDADEIFEYARRIVIAELQHVTYDEWLPALIGKNRKCVSNEREDPDGDQQITIEFASALYRLHSLISNETSAELEQYGVRGLASAFFKPGKIRQAKGNIDPFIRSIYTTVARKNDPQMVSDLQAFLFADQPGHGPIGHDLASRNGQRGRDQGAPGYNALRKAYGLERRETFEAVVGGPGPLAEAFKSVYDSPDECDLWFCAAAEPLVVDSSLGETQTLVIRKQFCDLYNSDIHYWEHSELLNDDDKAYVGGRTFSAILCDTTGVCDVSKDNAFLGTSDKSGDSTGSAALIGGLAAIGAILLCAIVGRFTL